MAPCLNGVSHVSHAPLTPDEIAERGEEIYKRELRAKVEPDYRGQFLVIDIHSGAYEIDADDLTASKRLLARHPNAEIYGLRIGYPAAYRIGGQSLRMRP
jgi:hypothetical protein